MSASHPLNPLRIARGLRARPRLLGAALVGIVVYGAVRTMLGESIAVTTLVAWNTGALLYLLLAWHTMATTPVQGIRDRAPGQDEGRIAILVLVVLAALAVLLAVGTQLSLVKDLHGPVRTAHVSLAALTVFTSWLFTQALFALHYAHDFYMCRVEGAPDPLAFPGTPDPGYADFFHFACVIGAAAQTADISFNGSVLRPVGTLHCILSFFFNATLLALSINLAAGLLL
jgi:uncharacterized membrane protein